jgi:hypothetical protein
VTKLVSAIEADQVKSYLQIVANHHLQHQEELSIGDEPISIDIVHVEGDYNLTFWDAQMQPGKSVSASLREK